MSAEESATSDEEKLPGAWTPGQLAREVGYSRQAIIHAINGKGKYPRRLYAEKIGQLWLIADSHAQAYIEWIRTGKLVEEPAREKVYWSIKEIADELGESRFEVERAVVGITAGKGKYTYPATLPAKKLGNYWLVEAIHAQQYIREKQESRQSQIE